MSDANYSGTDTSDNTTKTETETNPTNVFFSALFQQIVWIIIYIFVGGYMLYCSKISLTGLMPMDVEIMPYSSNNPKATLGIEPVININYVKETDETWSNKIYFPYTYNKELIDNSFIIGIGSSRNWIESLDSNAYTYYFGSIWQQMTSTYIQILFGFYGFLNGSVIETLIVFGGPYIILYVLFFINIIVGFYGVLLYYLYIPKLFSQKECVIIKIGTMSDTPSIALVGGSGGSESGDGSVTGSESLDSGNNSEYQDNKNQKSIVNWNDTPPEGNGGFGDNWFITIMVILIVLFASMFGSLFIILFFLIRANLSALLLPLFMKAQEISRGDYERLYQDTNVDKPLNKDIELMDKDDENAIRAATNVSMERPHEYDKDEEYTYYTVLEHILKYKKRIIMFIVSYYVLIDSFLSLGAYGGLLAIVGCIIIYIFFPDIYKSYKPNTSDDPLIDNDDNLTPASGIYNNKFIKDVSLPKKDRCAEINNHTKQPGFFGRLLDFLKSQKGEDEEVGEKDQEKIEEVGEKGEDEKKSEDEGEEKSEDEEKKKSGAGGGP